MWRVEHVLQLSRTSEKLVSSKKTKTFQFTILRWRQLVLIIAHDVLNAVAAKAIFDAPVLELVLKHKLPNQKAFSIVRFLPLSWIYKNAVNSSDSMLFVCASCLTDGKYWHFHFVSRFIMTQSQKKNIFGCYWTKEKTNRLAFTETRLSHLIRWQ